MIETCPIIFLDFDGVLNSRVTRHNQPKGWNKLDHTMVGRVSKIIARTGADVVVSSSWRLFDRGIDRDVVRMQRILDECGFCGKVIGVTPDLGSYYGRGLEIEAWLTQNVEPPWVPFVILDDMADMIAMQPWLIQTDDAIGLTDEQVERAVAMLKKQTVTPFMNKHTYVQQLCEDERDCCGDQHDH